MERKLLIDRFKFDGRRSSNRGDSPARAQAAIETFCTQHPSHLYVGGSLS